MHAPRSALVADQYAAILECAGLRPSTLLNTVKDAENELSRFHDVPPFKLKDVVISPVGINGGVGTEIQGNVAKSQVRAYADL